MDSGRIDGAKNTGNIQGINLSSGNSDVKIPAQPIKITGNGYSSSYANGYLGCKFASVNPEYPKDANEQLEINLDYPETYVMFKKENDRLALVGAESLNDEV